MAGLPFSILNANIQMENLKYVYICYVRVHMYIATFAKRIVLHSAVQNAYNTVGSEFIEMRCFIYNVLAFTEAVFSVQLLYTLKYIILIQTLFHRYSMTTHTLKHIA